MNSSSSNETTPALITGAPTAAAVQEAAASQAAAAAATTTPTRTATTSSSSSKTTKSGFSVDASLDACGVGDEQIMPTCSMKSEIGCKTKQFKTATTRTYLNDGAMEVIVGRAEAENGHRGNFTALATKVHKRRRDKGSNNRQLKHATAQTTT